MTKPVIGFADKFACFGGTPTAIIGLRKTVTASSAFAIWCLGILNILALLGIQTFTGYRGNEAMAGCHACSDELAEDCSSLPLPKPVVPQAFQPPVVPFDVNEVELLGGPFYRAQELDAAYLLRLEPDRLLHNFRKFAGLEPKGPIYGGWESMGIAGHSLGHYLSAASRMYRARRDERFRDRVDAIVTELAECQKAMGTGYVGGIPEGDRVFQELAEGKIRADGFNLNGVWVPWYTLHKLLAGLIDAFVYCGNSTALEVAEDFANWVGKVTGNLSEDEWQKMLICEHGGMNEALANLYALTGKREYLALSQRFYHRAVLDFLATREDRLAGHHANTQIPKVIGVARLFELTGEPKYQTIAGFFWDTVVAHHTYVNGGNSAGEYFGPPGKLSTRLQDTTETCNTYNMLKLTRTLFSWNPDARYGDYCERALINHILAHQHPESGMFVYKGFLDYGAVKHFSTPFDSFWCCVGTGMENHARYGEYIYFRGANDLYVNLYAASCAYWREKGVVLEQRTEYPEEDRVQIHLRCKNPVVFALHLRHPWWAVEPITITLNGQPVDVDSRPGSYLTIERNWCDGDRLELRLPMSLRVECMPDDPRMIAFFYGPVLLCAGVDNGEIPVLVCEGDDPIPYVRAEPAKMVFVTSGLAQPRDLELIPLYRKYEGRYNVYWRMMSPEQWKELQRREEARRLWREALLRNVVDEVQIGNRESEQAHGVDGERTASGIFSGRAWRHAVDGGWFAYRMKVLPDQPMAIWCTYWGSDAGGRDFQLQVDGQTIASQQLRNNRPNEFFEVIYPIPPELTQGKSEVTLRFQARPGRIAGGVFGCRTVRYDETLLEPRFEGE